MESPQFSRWMRWDERGNYEEANSPGVYILAHLRNTPLTSAPADPVASEVIYIGETTRNTLAGRWRQFDRTAFQGKAGHSGGRSYRELVGDAGEFLFVAAWPAKQLKEPHRLAFIKYLERELIWQYVQRWGRLPKCNIR